MIKFRPLEVDDAPILRGWFTDYEVVHYSVSAFLKPMTLSQIQDRIRHEYKTTESNYATGVIDTAKGVLIGYAGLAEISKQNRSARYYVLIGDKNYWSKGMGTEITKRILRYGFQELSLHRIHLVVSDLNTGGMHLFQKAGFVKEGTMRDACFRDGSYHNKIMMALLKSEWQQSSG